VAGLRLWFLLLAVVCVLGGAGCGEMLGENEPGEPKHPGRELVTEQESERIALEFVRSSPTFSFDGISDTLRLTGSEAAGPNRWRFHFTFQCRHAGYGNRSGMVMAEVITAHQAEVVVEEGKVVYAVLDGRWDMLKQESSKRGP